MGFSNRPTSCDLLKRYSVGVSSLTALSSSAPRPAFRWLEPCRFSEDRDNVLVTPPPDTRQGLASSIIPGGSPAAADLQPPWLASANPVFNLHRFLRAWLRFHVANVETACASLNSAYPVLAGAATSSKSGFGVFVPGCQNLGFISHKSRLRERPSQFCAPAPLCVPVTQ